MKVCSCLYIILLVVVLLLVSPATTTASSAASRRLAASTAADRLTTTATMTTTTRAATRPRTACHFYLWNAPSALFHKWCHHLMKDQVIEGRGGVKVRKEGRKVEETTSDRASSRAFSRFDGRSLWMEYCCSQHCFYCCATVCPYRAGFHSATLVSMFAVQSG